MSCLVAFHYRSYGTFCIYSKRLHNFHGGFTHYRNYRAEKVRVFSLHISEIFSGFLLFFLKKLLHFYWKRFTIKLFLNFLEMKKNGQVRLEGDYSSSFKRKIFKRRK